jgi:peptide/nickel transport system permease protein
MSELLTVLRRDRAFQLGIALVGVLLLLGLGAPWLAPHAPEAQHDTAAGANLPPGSVVWLLERADGRLLAGSEVEATASGYRLTRLGEARLLTRSELAPGAAGKPRRLRFWLGSDRYGRDLLSRLLYGARVSLLLAVFAVALALSLGILIGSLAAIGPAWLDNLLMRGVDALLAFPVLLLLLLVSALFRPDTVMLALILGGTSWMEISRLVRAEMRGVAAGSFVAAARSAGLPEARVLARHLLPNSLAPVFARGPLLVSDVILTESSLSFLGLGLQPPDASWGAIISDGRERFTETWWITLFPALLITVAVLGWATVGERLRHHLDPRAATLSSDSPELPSP